MNLSSLKPVIQIALVIGVGILAVWVTSLFVSQKNDQTVTQVVQQVIAKKPTCSNTSDDFSKLVAAGQVVTLASNLNSYGKDGSFVNEKVTVVKRAGSGSEIACGYLYAEVSIANRPMQEQWENLYINPAEFGGHIVDSNAIVDKQSTTTTMLLFDLSKMTYRPGLSSQSMETANWASLLDVSDKVTFRIALNTTSPAGKIVALQLAYRCWNPSTGQETSDCQLSVVQ